MYELHLYAIRYVASYTKPTLHRRLVNSVLQEDDLRQDNPLTYSEQGAFDITFYLGSPVLGDERIIISLDNALGDRWEFMDEEAEYQTLGGESLATWEQWWDRLVDHQNGEHEGTYDEDCEDCEGFFEDGEAFSVEPVTDAMDGVLQMARRTIKAGCTLKIVRNDV